MPPLSRDSLTGVRKQPSDIRSTPFRLRYTKSQTVGAHSNGPIRFTLPRRNAAFLDASSLVWRGKLNVTTTDGNARLAGHDVVILINRCRVLSSNKVIYDCDNNALISNFTNALVSVSDIEYKNYERSLSDYPQDETRQSQVDTAHTMDRLIIGKLGPKNSFVNGNHLIPLGNLSSPLHIEIYWAAPQSCFISNDPSLTYSISDLELNWSSVYSASFDNLYRSESITIHCQDYGHRYNYITTGTTTSNILIPSSSSNVSSILTWIRNQQENTGYDITKEKYEYVSIPATDIAEVDFRISTKSIYEEPTTSPHDWYNELHHAFPSISTSRYFTGDGYKGNQNVLAISLSGAPRQFSHALLSGIQTSILNTDMVLQIMFNGPTTEQLQLDSYVISDVIYRFSPDGRIDVQL